METQLNVEVFADAIDYLIFMYYLYRKFLCEIPIIFIDRFITILNSEASGNS